MVHDLCVFGALRPFSSILLASTNAPLVQRSVRGNRQAGVLRVGRHLVTDKCHRRDLVVPAARAERAGHLGAVPEVEDAHAAIVGRGGDEAQHGRHIEAEADVGLVHVGRVG